MKNRPAQDPSNEKQMPASSNTASGHTTVINPSASPEQTRGLSPEQPSAGENLNVNFTIRQHLNSDQVQPTIRTLFILLCVPVGSPFKHTIIDLRKYDSDATFFPQVRKECRCLRGWLRHYLSLSTFHFCHASKFERWAVNELSRKVNELPPHSEKEYIYMPFPREIPYITPLSEHEWTCRMRGTMSSRIPNDDEALNLLPKRKASFQVNTHMKREFMWGLCAEYRLSFLRFVVWHALIAAGGLAFMVYWLSNHNGDWQNASVPILVILAALTVLWLPLSERFKEGTGW